jgi:hypothetical protein
VDRLDALSRHAALLSPFSLGSDVFRFGETGFSPSLECMKVGNRQVCIEDFALYRKNVSTITNL